LPGDLTRFAARLLPARPDLAAAHLHGQVAAARYVGGEPRQVTAAVLDLTSSPEPGAGLATQLLHGERFTVYETRDDGLVWGQSARDGYVGYVQASGLGAPGPAGQRVTALWAQLYPRPEVKARTVAELPFLAEVAVDAEERGFSRVVGGGWVASQHLAPVAGDAADQAARFLGVPYLWGGRSARGIDCSGLVQLALAAVGIEAPRDSDMQEALLGVDLEPEAPPRRGDLVFWKGHVGMLRDPETLIHANGHHMAVAIEPFAAAAARIEAAGGGPVTARRRVERTG
jgi:cell wall-associated NlpC family hydrolase